MANLGSLAVAVCACLSPAIAVAQKPFSEKFTHDVMLDPGWVLAEPNPASSYAFRKGLVLEASAKNGGSDLWPSTNYNASLLLQPISSGRSYTVTTKVHFRPSDYYMGAGLVLTTQTNGFSPSSVFHRFEFCYCSQRGIGIASFTNGETDPKSVIFSGSVVYLRLQTSQTIYTYSYSADGNTYTQISTFNDPTRYKYIGLISDHISYDGQMNLKSRPVFKSFKITSAKK